MASPVSVVCVGMAGKDTDCPSVIYSNLIVDFMD